MEIETKTVNETTTRLILPIFIKKKIIDYQKFAKQRNITNR